MHGWKVRVLPFSVVVDAGWNGKCSRNEMSLYHLPMSGEATHIAGAP